mmetsp:Transcript_91378/g.295520  ORF Transcript_91378/g.295520 Transcript_91378/m.295520 type:complete len:265 (+) Transcript_91378:4168-4962(+)
MPSHRALRRCSEPSQWRAILEALSSSLMCKGAATSLSKPASSTSRNIDSTRSVPALGSRAGKGEAPASSSLALEAQAHHVCFGRFRGAGRHASRKGRRTSANQATVAASSMRCSVARASSSRALPCNFNWKICVYACWSSSDGMIQLLLWFTSWSRSDVNHQVMLSRRLRKMFALSSMLAPSRCRGPRCSRPLEAACKSLRSKEMGPTKGAAVPNCTASPVKLKTLRKSSFFSSSAGGVCQSGPTLCMTISVMLTLSGSCRPSS